MIRSMTGFASKTDSIETPHGERSNVTINLKSLNSRYFETNFRVPSLLSSLETGFTRILKKNLLRGYVHCSIHLTTPSLFKGTICPNKSAINEYVKAGKDIVDDHPSVTGPLSINTILTLPNVFSAQDQEIDDNSKKVIAKALEEAIQELIVQQEKEGTALEKDLRMRIQNMQQGIKKITELSKQMVEEQKEKVHNTLQELESDESRFAEIKRSALYVVLDKIDIHEEVVRFSNHLENLVKLLDKPSVEKGKRLDFTLQELAREINTIAAKCSNVAIGSTAIDIKVEIEKSREQTQNIL